MPHDELRAHLAYFEALGVEGIHPDPDLPDLAPHVRAVCVKDHRGLRAEGNFPVPGTGQVDHDLLFRTLFAAGFRGPISVERVDGTEDAAAMTAEVIDERIARARAHLLPILERHARTAAPAAGAPAAPGTDAPAATDKR